MKYLLLFAMLLFFDVSPCFPQKPLIDLNAFDKWPLAMNPAISNDGNYALYTIYNLPVGSNTLVIRSTNNNWKMEFPNVASGVFTEDNRKAIFMKPQDTLCILTLKNSRTENIPHASSFRLFKQGNNEWLVYQLNTPEKELVLLNPRTGRQQSFTAVTEYLLSNDGKTLLLKTESSRDSTTMQALNWVNLVNGNNTSIWQGAMAYNFVLDANATQLAFMIPNKEYKNAIWYYKAGTDKAVLLADEQSNGIDSNLTLNNISSFTKDGNGILFRLKEKDYIKAKSDAVKVDIWNYKDPKLQSEQLEQINARHLIFGGGPRNFAAAIRIHDRTIFRLQQENETMVLFNNGAQTDSIVLLRHLKENIEEWNWNPAYQRTFYAVSTRNGDRKLLNLNNVYESSPGTKYIIGMDTALQNFYSYDLAAQTTHNITQTLPIPLVDSEYDQPDHKPRGLQTAAWLANDEALLIYDKFDIWQIDPTGHQPSVSITNGFGRKHNIVFRLASNNAGKAISNKQRLILTAFNRTNKNNGFYSKQLNKKGDPELLTMGPYIYDIPGNYPTLSDFTPLKARDAESYIVERMSASTSPNYFFTSDFKIFTPLSNVYPEKDYNWLSSELITCKGLDGRETQGVLYKPENFDPQKKYPVIFHYYEKKSDYLNAYERPEASSGPINIPWFVSHGYVVFTPDIHYTIGEPGQSAYNAVVGAAKHLMTFLWVDANRMGIQGHSFGGYETNYIVTHTNLFAAAISSAGPCDLVSFYNSLWGGGFSKQASFELDQIRMGATLWQRPDLYIKNSPIFLADKISTPLLIMSNKQDGANPFSQGVEFFTALRRLQKKVWMLQYDDGSHTLRGKDAIDYTMRITQFFDHYLKGASAPKWMTVGVPARLKGIEPGMELDTSERTLNK
jgi:dienelactone hydrolase